MLPVTSKKGDIKMDLSEKNIRAAKPGDILRDPNIKGLHLRVFEQSAGFYLYYRTKTGTQRKPKLGDHGSITLAQARKVAQAMLADVAMGTDPSAVRAVARAEPTLADLWDQFWERHIQPKKSAYFYKKLWRCHLEPRMGNVKLSAITYLMVDNLHKQISKAGPVNANRVVTILSGMFSFAKRPLEWIDKNPCEGMKMNKEVGRRRYMSGDEAVKIAELISLYSKERPAAAAFLMLLIYTGARKSEIANARWEWLNGNVLNLPDSKTGAKQIFLPPQALEILDRLPRTHGTITGLASPQRLWYTIRAEAGCPDLRMHDLRHSFASSALSAGFSLAQIGGLLGHKNTQTTMRYAHLVDEVAVAAATVTADLISLSMQPKKKLNLDDLPSKLNVTL